MALTIESAKKITDKLRTNFRNGRTLSYHYRYNQLDCLLKLIQENNDKICQALYTDLNKPSFESALCEVDLLKKEIIETKRNLHEWMQPVAAERDLSTVVNQLELRRDPLGLTLILGAWNYPVALTLGPLIGSIAGGNVTFCKPSEAAKASSDLLCQLISKYLDPETTVCYAMQPGHTPKLMKEIDFEHVFFTGGTAVGKIIMKDAARNLAKCTLELGGKNPVYVEDGADVKYACKRMMAAKSLNAGQICLDVDYILCSKNMQEKLIQGFKDELNKIYPKGQIGSSDYCKLIHKGHFDKMCDWMAKMPANKLAIGGKTDKKGHLLETTVYKDVSETDVTMDEEIFGPILSILPVANNIDEAIKFVNKRDKPLVSYIFSNNPKSQERFLIETSSGGACVNDMLMHYCCDSLPFGGVGASGMGSYHGKYSFECFTHLKGVYKQSAIGKMAMDLVSPPYSNLNQKILGALFLGPPFDYKNSLKFFAKVFNIGVYVACAVLFYEKYYK